MISCKSHFFVLFAHTLPLCVLFFSLTLLSSSSLRVTLLALLLNTTGVVLVVAGVVFQSIVLVLAVPWYHPQVLVLLLVLGASVIYLKPDNVERQLGALGSILTSPTLVLDVLDNLSERDVRHVLYGALWFPTLLEMHTIGFLSSRIVETGWTYTTLTTLLALAITLYRKQLSQRRSQQQQQQQQDSTTTIRTTTTTSPKDDVTTVVLVLYASALVACLWRLSLYHVPFLAAPFCLSTGTLLLYREESEWLSGALRQALRYTLRDVLVHLGTHVQQDEMLQLAMLRWIVDYWSYQPTETNAVDDNNNTEPSTTTNDNNNNNDGDATVAAGTLSELQWDDLLPMLTATTEQMEQEAQLPPPPTDNVSGGNDVADTPPETESSSHNNPSLENLKSMLSRMNLDESARPAVESYRRAVQNFPPSRARALLVAIGRRCPAMLLLCVRYVTGVSAFFSSTLCLLPLVVMEGLRVLRWAESCEGGHHHETHEEKEKDENNNPNDANEDSTTIKKKNLTQDPLVPLSMEPMWILLSGDVYSPRSPPTLLQVWRNVESSVSALEAGLSAARCVQTTAVAVDFCGNLASLAHLGVEVSQQGWQHGLAVMAQELIHLHVENGGNKKIRYTAAAVQAVRNGQIVAQNLHQMMQDDDLHPAIEPIVHVLTAIAGRGWLWGTNEPPPPQVQQEESTVKIEIIKDDAKEAQEPNDRPIPVVSSNMGVQPSDRLVVEDELRPSRQDSRETPTEAVESPATPGLLDEPSLSQSQCDELISVHDASTEEEEEEDVEDDDDDDDDDNGVGSRSWEATIEEEIRVREGVAFSAHGRPTSSSTPPTTTTQAEQDGTEDWAKWVGGGLAVLGAAVVGGVALAHSASSGGDQSSSVVIEELDENATNDDLDEDEWISVSNNYK